MSETAQTRVWWRGVQITARMRDQIRYAERRFQKRYPGVTFVPTQGSWRNGTLSGGTHSGAGSIDWRTWHLTIPQRVYMIRCLKDAGAAIWFRPRNWDGAGGAEHAHMLDRVTTNMAASARWQVAQYDARRSGLRSNEPDLTYRPAVPVKWSYPLKRPVPR